MYWIMHLSKRIFIKIIEKLINEGVYIIPKSQIFNAISNTYFNSYQVYKVITSLKTRKLINEIYCWRIYYWTLTRKGYNYIKNYLRII
uniref:Ribosomal protein S10 n=1 Tax=Lotharella vacuolata TaxID=74820 RepID=A0A0H5BQV8_9EUKA|nr:ribosomal protein S10 [Lotharella vacuolata]